MNTNTHIPEKLASLTTIELITTLEKLASLTTIELITTLKKLDRKCQAATREARQLHYAIDAVEAEVQRRASDAVRT